MRLKDLKRAVRYQRNDQSRMAVLELDALIDQNEQSWTAYVLRARARMTLMRFDEAIVDFTHVLLRPEFPMNKRNRLRLLYSVVECSTQLSGAQESSLYRALQNGMGLDVEFRPTKTAIVRTQPVPSVTPTRSPARPSAEGRIADIGKFLLDAKDIKKLALLLGSGELKNGIRRLSTYDLGAD